MAFWWCLQHSRTEPDEGCAHAERLGPYDTADAAAHALDRAAERTKSWDEADEEWNNR